MIQDILFIDGHAMDMPEGKAVTLTYKSPLLTDISKQSANYSQTINLPRTARNERLLGLPLDLTAQSATTAFRYKRKPGRLERNGLTIAEGEVYLLDSSSNDIAVAFIFGRHKGLEALKELELDINELDIINQMASRNWKVAADTAFNTASIRFPAYNCGLTQDEMTNANVGYYGAVSIPNKIIPAIAQYCGGITLTDEANTLLSELFLMCQTANDNDRSATQAATSLTPTGAGTIKGENWEIIGSSVRRTYDAIPTLSGATQYDGKYGEVVTATIDGVSKLAYQATAEQRLLLYVNNFQVKLRTAVEYEVAFMWLASARLVAVVYNPATDTTRRIYGDKPNSAGYLSAYNSGSLFGWQVTFTDGIYIDLEEGEQVQFRVMIPAPNNTDATITDVVYPTDVKITYRSSGLKQPIKIGEPYQPSGNLPAMKPIDFLKGLASMLGLYITAEGDGLKIATLNEVLGAIGEAEDWTSRLLASDKGVILNHYFSLGEYNAQRNIIKFKDDSADPDAEKFIEDSRDIILVCDNEGLEKEKTIVTLPFGATYKGNMRHYTYKPAEGDNPAEADRKTLTPRIVRLKVTSGLLTANTQGLAGDDLASVNYQGLQKIVREPHRIKVNVKMTAWELKHVDLTRPVYFAQFGCYFLIEEIQTTSNDITELQLIKLNQ